MKFKVGDWVILKRNSSFIEEIGRGPKQVITVERQGHDRNKQYLGVECDDEDGNIASGEAVNWPCSDFEHYKWIEEVPLTGLEKEIDELQTMGYKGE
jgi:hypothetical protein